MTMRGPMVLVDGYGEPSSHEGWSDLESMMSDSLIDRLELLHLFGTDFPTGFKKPGGNPEKSIFDHSLHGRHAERFNAAPGTKSVVLGGTAYYRTALSLDQALTICGGQMIWFGVAKVPNANSVLMGTYNGATVDGAIVGRPGAHYMYRISYADGAKTDITSGAIASDTGGGTGSGEVWELLAFQIDNIGLGAKLFRHKHGGVLQTVTQALVHPVVGSGQIGIGRTTPGGQYTANIEVAAAGIVSGLLDDTGFSSFRAGLLAGFAPYGIDL